MPLTELDLDLVFPLYLIIFSKRKMGENTATYILTTTALSEIISFLTRSSFLHFLD